MQPIRSVSPHKPHITFTYHPSPVRSKVPLCQTPNSRSQIPQFIDNRSDKNIIPEQLSKQVNQKQQMSRMPTDNNKQNKPSLIQPQAQCRPKIACQLPPQISSQDNVRQLYRQKRLKLKNHYERIKMTIKEAIQSDIEALERRQKEHIQFIQEQSKENSGLAELKSIGSLSSISKVTEQEYFKLDEVDKDHLYDPETYKKVSAKHKDSILFSFEQKKV